MKSVYKIDFIDKHPSLEETVNSKMENLRAAGKKVYCQYHRMGPYQGFPVHRHFTTNEWTVVYDGVVDFLSGKDARLINSTAKCVIIYSPMGACHTIRSKGMEIRYAVIKDGLDDFNLC